MHRHESDHIMHQEAVDRASLETRHKEFQFGHNPMEMSPLEMSLAFKEKAERIANRHNYIHGIQGRDGGHGQHTIRHDIY